MKERDEKQKLAVSSQTSLDWAEYQVVRNRVNRRVREEKEE